jgi:glycosyltransferase involved in cell wall biosynthesis
VPDLTIITVTYNAALFVERTLKSLAVQSQTNFEYIVIDGNSKDDTLHILSKYSFLISKLISEPDNGIYDAMNKGLKLATGKYVWFMNAGDEVYDEDTVCNLRYYMKDVVDIIYGDTMMVSEDGLDIGLRSNVTPHKLPNTLTKNSFRYGMVVCHQSFIVKKEIAPAYIQHNLSADIDWEIKCVEKSKTSVKTDFIISKYLLGGISKQNHRKSLIDRFLVLKTHFGVWQNLLAHLYIILRSIYTNIFFPRFLSKFFLKK